MTPGSASRADRVLLRFHPDRHGRTVSCGRARRPRRDWIHGRARLRRGAPARDPAPARRPAPGGARGAGPRERRSASRTRGTRTALARAFEGASVVASLAGPVPRARPRARGRGDPRPARTTSTPAASRPSRAHRVRAVRAGGRAARGRAAHLVRLRLRPGDLAARLAADGLEPVEEVVVAVRGLRHALEPAARRPHDGQSASPLVDGAARAFALRRHVAR